jgi:hypothetical protein
MDWPIVCVVIGYGAVCWLAGWHGSIRASGRMYDEGFKAGYTAATTASAIKGESK